MPEIKNQFTGGKMNKDVDERLVPKGEYKDAMNIQVSTSEGSDVGTIQNILGNLPGCTADYIQSGSYTVGSIADEKNDSLYWLVSGSENVSGQSLLVDEDISFKDMIIRHDVSGQTCQPVFVDKYKFCIGLSGLSGVGNSIILPDSDLLSQIVNGMNATGYGNNNVIFGPTPINGIGAVTMLPLNYQSEAIPDPGVPFTPPDIPIGDINNTNMYIRGFWDDTTSKYTNIHYDQSVDTTFAPISQANLPPDGASQFWIPASDLPAPHNITPGSQIQSVLAQSYYGCPGGGNCNANVLNGFGHVTVYDIVLGQVTSHLGIPIQAWIITVGIPGGQYDGGINRVHYCWSDQSGNQYGCSWMTGIWQKDASILAGYQNAEAFPFYELETNIAPITFTQYTYTVTNVINIEPTSSGWLDEVYNVLFDENGQPTGSALQITSTGGGSNFPPNSCIDPNSVIDAVGFDPATGSYDNEFEIIDCSTGVAIPDGVILQNTNGDPITLWIIGDALDAIILSEDVDFTGVDTVCFESDRILNFDQNRLITGIDIIDDMLFWTDNFSEPKKINISRSIQGTDPSGEIHTAVINQDAGYNLTPNYNPIKEEHITVIKKTPKNALNLELSDGRDPSLSYAGITGVGLDTATSSIINSSNPAVQYDFSTLSIGDTVSFYIQTDYDGLTQMDFAWEEGGYLLLREFNEGPPASAPNVPLANWTIRGLITEWQSNKFENITGGLVQVQIQVVGLNGTPLDPDPNNLGGSLYYVVDYEDTDPVIFEDKLPRFSYRYKYEDGEYSTFAPWSEVAFLPTGFDYEPKRGWNTGMLNNLKSIKVKGFKPTTAILPTGRDVVEIDILYKEDTSPNVYLVQSISPVDILPAGISQLPWYSGEYIIKSETIKATLPSNQLLRPWDNVPKKALAQSISGNRMIYANYEQNYDLKVNGQSYKPDFKNSLTAWTAPILGVPEKSIKSLRDYKLGVVFTDKYGRETPVLISENGGFKVEKKDSLNANRLKVGLRGSVPPEMTYYKFYIKETSSEYYNLAMDRWYNAEDGNLWLAFPSSDRNKVDLDTSLYFKRGVDGDENVFENSTRYKVLAIENEAPEFIKTRRIRIGTVAHYAGTNQLFGNTTDNLSDAPRVTGVSFKMNYYDFFGTSLSKMEDIKEDIYIQFVSSGDYSSQYKVSEITSDFDATATPAATNPGEYHVTLDTNLKDDINFIFDDASGANFILDDTKVVFTKAVVENKPKFDGRFFAKIENDGKIQTQITDDSVGVNYLEVTSKKVYLLEDDSQLKDISRIAVTTPGISLVQFDYSGYQFTGGYMDGNTEMDIENPGGINQNYHAARNAYFQLGRDFESWDYSNPGGGGGFSNIEDWHHWTNKLFYPEMINENWADKGYKSEIDQSQVGVWFIDRSTKKYSLSTSGPDDNALVWPGDSDIWPSSYGPHNMNHVSPACNFATNSVLGGCGFTGAAWFDDTGGGITHTSTHSLIDLGFGGFGGIENWAADLSNDFGDCGINGYDLDDSITDTDNYFGVGNGNTNWNDSQTTKFVEALSAGFTFRWREDPTETIYKIEGQTSYQKNYRFGRVDDGFCNNRTHLTGALSSYTKTFSIKVTPSMVGWDPAAPPGTYMTNGLHLGNGVFHDTLVVTGITGSPSSPASVSSGDATMMLQDVSSIKVGMSAGTNTNIPLASKVVSVDPLTNIIVLDLGTTGTIAAGTTLSFGFTIRIVSAHMYGIAGNLILPRENYIIVDRKTTECSNGNTLKPTYTLHKGMKLDMYNLDSSSDIAGDMCIKEIDEHPNGWKLTMGGYNGPINYWGGSGGGNLSVNFAADNRMVFKQVSMNGASNFTEANTDLGQVNAPHLEGYPSFALGRLCAVGYDMVILEPVDEYSDGGNLPENPFVWETEPKEDTDLDIYYEISENNPTKLSRDTINTAIPINSIVTSNSGEGGTWNNVTVVFNSSASGQEIGISELMWVGPGLAPNGTYPLEVGSILQITKPNGVVFSVEIEEIFPYASFMLNASNRFKLKNSLHRSNYHLNWHNCYSFGNGVESNRIKDTFNSPFISNGVKVSSTLGEDYNHEHRKSGLIYSGIYNSTSGVNNLNQFIAAEKITKDINPIYGSIQKLQAGWGQAGDLIALCEDRILKILANKDALFNADGNTNITATNKVLGTATPYSGEYGISKNPESFASEAYRAYFTDKVRGAVMRLSMDGLTAISDHGMKDWFRKNLKLSNRLIGSYDDKKDEYNITLPDVNKTVSFKEDVRGWVSFKSFVPENGISCANEYFTFKQGEIWKHHDETPYLPGSGNRNTFYGTFSNSDWSSFTAILNEAPGSIKTFHTLNYEGTQSKIDALTNYNIYIPGTANAQTGTPGVVDVNYPLGISDGEYYNLTAKEGWYVEDIHTDLESGGLNEFIEKEGKWFNYIKGKVGSVTDGGNIISGFDNADFSFQGLGMMVTAPTISSAFGCTDDSTGTTPSGVVYNIYVNYDPLAQANDGSCMLAVLGCTDPNADNYDCATAVNSNSTSPCSDFVTVDDGSCNIYGCLDSNANNTNLTATVHDQSQCTYDIYGCMNSDEWNQNLQTGSILNYDPLATVPCNGINGNYPNYTPIPCELDDTELGTYQTGLGISGLGCCCQIAIPGCMDPTASNFNEYATVSCIGCCLFNFPGCTISTACNYDNTANNNDGSCTFCNDPLANNFDGYDTDGVTPLATCDIGCVYCMAPTNLVVAIPEAPISQQTNVNIVMDTPLVPPGAQISSFTVEYSSDGGATFTTFTNTWVPYGINSSTGTIGVFLQISGLTAGTDYTFRVTSNCSAGTSLLNPTWSTTSSTTVTGSTSPPPPPGCTDPLACNYDNTPGLVDDGSCIDAVNCTGCGTIGYDEFCDTCWDPILLVAVPPNTVGGGPYVFTDGALCQTPNLGGCMTQGASNYDSTATFDDGSCYYDIFGCSDPLGINYNSAVTIDDGSCLYCEYGCTDPLAFLYSPTATCDNQTCLHPGCTDPTADNYGWGNVPGDGTNPNPWPANFAYPGNNQIDFGAGTFQYTTATGYEDNSCTYPAIPGCTYGDDNPMIPYGSIYSSPGQLWNMTALNYPLTYAVIYGQYIYPGMTEPAYSALNYDPTANTEDGSCMWDLNVFGTTGCTDPTAMNYNQNWTNPDDGSCYALEFFNGSEIGNNTTMNLQFPNFTGSNVYCDTSTWTGCPALTAQNDSVFIIPIDALSQDPILLSSQYAQMDFLSEITSTNNFPGPIDFPALSAQSGSINYLDLQSNGLKHLWNMLGETNQTGFKDAVLANASNTPVDGTPWSRVVDIEYYSMNTAENRFLGTHTLTIVPGCMDNNNTNFATPSIINTTTYGSDLSINAMDLGGPLDDDTTPFVVNGVMDATVPGCWNPCNPLGAC